MRGGRGVTKVMRWVEELALPVLPEELGAQLKELEQEELEGLLELLGAMRDYEEAVMWEAKEKRNEKYGEVMKRYGEEMQRIGKELEKKLGQIDRKADKQLEKLERKTRVSLKRL